MNVLIVLGHPRVESFSGALADAYKIGALNAKTHVKQINVVEMQFEPNVFTISPRNQYLEKDVQLAQELITWADHLVFVYPIWWGTMPALLKAFLDRVLTPGFAFEEIHGSNNWEKLLTGKSAEIITTMDTPLWVFRWLHKSPGHNAMAKSTLQYCGIKPVKILNFSPINDSSIEIREQWLKKVEQSGFQLKNGLLSKREKIFNKVLAWLKAIRLQFYPMTWIAYTAGAYGAANIGYTFDRSIFWIGYLWLFLVEVATVLSNEYHDYKTDSMNKYFGPFTGGSRVIVENDLTFKEIKRGIFASISISLLVAVVLLWLTPGSLLITSILLLIVFILALGYTIPPLKLSYRGLGELNVGLTHSFGVILCGFVFQGGNLAEPFPWLLSTPLFLAIIPSIILAGVPDYEADKATFKNTIPVKLGRKTAAKLAIIFTIVSAIAAIFVYQAIIPNIGSVVYCILIHAAILTFFLYKYTKQPFPSAHVNLLLILSLTYIIWFGILPVLSIN